MYDTILSPIDYGGLQLKNRIIFAPTTFGLSDEEYLAEMERLAKGGCAMIIIGDVPVAKSRFEKSLFDKKGFAFYQQICETAHKYGCKVCAQLHQTDTDMMSIIKCIPGMLMKKITPDQLRERMNDAVGPYITKMSQKKIHQIIAGFGKAAVLAKQAGFDMVQVKIMFQSKGFSLVETACTGRLLGVPGAQGAKSWARMPTARQPSGTGRATVSGCSQPAR